MYQPFLSGNMHQYRPRLIEADIIKLDKNKNIIIEFLVEQRAADEKKAGVNAENGKAGGRPTNASKGLIRLYLIKCFNESETFFKAGITRDRLNKRYSSKTGNSPSMPYSYEVIFDKIIDHSLAIHIEEHLHNNYKKYVPMLQFGGHKECYLLTEPILNYIEYKTQTKPNGLFSLSESKPNIEAKLTNIEVDIELDKSKSKKALTRTVFVPPTVNEVQAYLDSESIKTINAQYFVDYYTARGWQLKSGKMKCWKAAVRTWKANNYSTKTKNVEKCADFAGM